MEEQDVLEKQTETTTPSIVKTKNGFEKLNKGLDTRFHTKDSISVNIKKLVRELKHAVSGEVRFDDGSRALYSTDASNYRQYPMGVVLPKTEEDIINTVRICHKYKAPIVNRGGGTSLAGQSCNVAVMMDMTKYYNQILAMSKENKTVTIQPGIVLDEMRHATEKKMGLTFGPDPATHSHCALGGMLGNDSCGIHSVMSQFYGNGARTADNVESMTILTYDGVKMKVGPTSEDELNRIIREGGRRGEIYQRMKALVDKYAVQIRHQFPNIPRRVSGYNLPALLPENGFNVAKALVGSESTLVTILEATMMLIHDFKARSLVVLGYEDLPDAGYAVPQILKHKPIGLEGIDHLLIEFMKRKDLNVDDIPLLPKGNAWLLVEFGGETKEESDAKARKLMDELSGLDHPPFMKLCDDDKKEKKLWEVRESGLGATAWVPGEPKGHPGWEDSAVPPDKVGDYLRDFRKLFDKYDYKPSIYGHFGQGCIHCRIGFDLLTKEGIEKYKKFTVEASHLVVKYGGSNSGEHGDGQARGDLLDIMFGPEIMEAFREFKSIWDPEWKMNPGKVLSTYGQTNDLRQGSTYNPPVLKTVFKYPTEEHSWEKAADRCVGVGNCRRHEHGTMCPSYMVTREEKDSTRGRSRMLFEMMEGDVLKKRWKNKYVKESLDLCLACKGCKADCPVNVDMATYKSEFLHHYYKGRLRPITAYLFGYIYWWSRLASLLPSVANFFTSTPVIRNIVKAFGGIAQKRKLPQFAPQTFRHWHTHQPSRQKTSAKKVILWPDTFNNFFLPETLVAGQHVLEAAGFEVMIPKISLCCGRPLYDFGMLDTAKKMLKKIMQTMQDEINEGIPIVGLEPSCVAVFRDELVNIFPKDQLAQRLRKQVFTLGEFLSKEAPDFKIPKIENDAIVQGHCHHKAIMKMDGEENVLKKSGLKYELLDSGCCGMAGYFGYEKGDHYDVSIKAGERVLLPRVRSFQQEGIVIADGFSCREQIEQNTNRKGLHLAQVLDMAINEKIYEPYPAKKYLKKTKLRATGKQRLIRTAVLAGIAGIVVACIMRNKKHKNGNEIIA